MKEATTRARQKMGTPRFLVAPCLLSLQICVFLGFVTLGLDDSTTNSRVSGVTGVIIPWNRFRLKFERSH